jgi:SPP1 family predicted phage head-tail adaptor
MLLHLPHRVSVMQESRSTVSIGGGCYTTSWTTSSVEWANCQVSNNISDKKESHELNKKQQFTRWNIIMRANTNITNANRLIYNNKILTVETVSDPTARGRMIQLECREEVQNV